jgi:hypothetical protein
VNYSGVSSFMFMFLASALLAGEGILTCEACHHQSIGGKGPNVSGFLLQKWPNFYFHYLVLSNLILVSARALRPENCKQISYTLLEWPAQIGFSMLLATLGPNIFEGLNALLLYWHCHGLALSHILGVCRFWGLARIRGPKS